jgi:membrane-bound serine protease (ClpP class)
VVFPIIWFLIQRRKKSRFGPGRILGETGIVKEWREKEGYVFVDGELWKAISGVALKRDDKVIIQKMEGLTVKVRPVNPETDSK